MIAEIIEYELNWWNKLIDVFLGWRRGPRPNTFPKESSTGTRGRLAAGSSARTANLWKWVYAPDFPPKTGVPLMCIEIIFRNFQNYQMDHDTDTNMLFDLIARMLEYEPYKRMTLREVNILNITKWP